MYLCYLHIIKKYKKILRGNLRTNFMGKKFLRFYLFIFREGKGGRERKRNINLWLPLERPLLGTWPATQACALTGNQTSDPLVHRPALSPLIHTSQGGSILSFIFLFN